MERDLRVEDLQIEFRQIQKPRMRDLSTVEWLAPFGAWYDEYMAGIEAKRAGRGRGLRRLSSSGRETTARETFSAACAARKATRWTPSLSVSTSRMFSSRGLTGSRMSGGVEGRRARI